MRTTASNIHKFYVLPTQCIYVFCVDLRKTAIISLYNIKWLVFITEMECVCCAVQTGSLCIILRSAHTVYLCFVWIWEQTAIISLYNINMLVSISVYCVVRTQTLKAAATSRNFPSIQPHFFCMLLWSDGQMGEAWERSKKQCSFGNGKHWTETFFHTQFKPQHRPHVY